MVASKAKSKPKFGKVPTAGTSSSSPKPDASSPRPKQASPRPPEADPGPDSLLDASHEGEPSANPPSEEAATSSKLLTMSPQAAKAPDQPGDEQSETKSTSLSRNVPNASKNLKPGSSSRVPKRKPKADNSSILEHPPSPRPGDLKRAAGMCVEKISDDEFEDMVPEDETPPLVEEMVRVMEAVCLVLDGQIVDGVVATPRWEQVVKTFKSDDFASRVKQCDARAIFQKPVFEKVKSSYFQGDSALHPEDHTNKAAASLVEWLIALVQFEQQRITAPVPKPKIRPKASSTLQPRKYEEEAQADVSDEDYSAALTKGMSKEAKEAKETKEIEVQTEPVQLGFITSESRFDGSHSKGVSGYPSPHQPGPPGNMADVASNLAVAMQAWANTRESRYLAAMSYTTTSKMADAATAAVDDIMDPMAGDVFAQSRSLLKELNLDFNVTPRKTDGLVEDDLANAFALGEEPETMTPEKIALHRTFEPLEDFEFETVPARQTESLLDDSQLKPESASSAADSEDDKTVAKPKVKAKAKAGFGKASTVRGSNTTGSTKPTAKNLARAQSAKNLNVQKSEAQAKLSADKSPAGSPRPEDENDMKEKKKQRATMVAKK